MNQKAGTGICRQ